MGEIRNFNKTVCVQMYYNNENRRIIQLYENQKEVIGSYVDDDQLMSVFVMKALLDYIEKGYKIIVKDNWRK